MKIVHFHNGTGGGVLSVIRNLLAHQQRPDLEHHVIYTINREQISDYRIPGLTGASSEQVFYYSTRWNFYYTCRQLAKLLPAADAVLVAHDWLELGMVSLLGLPNPVVQFLHGDYPYYYQLAEKHAAWIDQFICVSNAIEKKLLERLPERCATIVYLRFPVPHVHGKRIASDETEIVFAGRCEESKGYFLLPIINRMLQEQRIAVRWHIAGAGSEKKALQEVWGDATVHFYGNISYSEVSNLLLSASFFVLPSVAEGMPVSIVEAMKAGAIPIVNDLNGGIRELVENGITGYRITDNQPSLYVQRIQQLLADTATKNMISAAAMAYANSHFDPIFNTKIIEDRIVSITQKLRMKKAKRTFGSRLDHPAIPNFFVSMLRGITKR